MRNRFFSAGKCFILGVLSCVCVMPTTSLMAYEPSLWKIYNTLYGEAYVSSTQELRDNYGVDYDEIWLQSNGYVVARARFAEYKQKFGYYTDACVGNERVDTLVIAGERLAINPFYTLPRFEPDGGITPMSKLVFGDFMVLTVLLNPNPATGEVNLILDTRGEFAVANNLPITISLLPWILDEDNRMKSQVE